MAQKMRDTTPAAKELRPKGCVKMQVAIVPMQDDQHLATRSRRAVRHLCL